MDSDTRFEYAAANDFCSIFQKDMASFYQLAFLLTADRDSAEHVFLAAFEECLNSIAVFNERASSWARRVIVTNALRSAAPLSSEVSNAQAEECRSDRDVVSHFSKQTITRLSPFTRFVFVMTVLEKFSVAESAVLLRVSRKAVLNGQLRAMLALGQQARTYIPGIRAKASLILAKPGAAQSPDLPHEIMFSEMTA